MLFIVNFRWGRGVVAGFVIGFSVISNDKVLAFPEALDRLNLSDRDKQRLYQLPSSLDFKPKYIRDLEQGIPPIKKYLESEITFFTCEQISPQILAKISELEPFIEIDRCLLTPFSSKQENFYRFTAYQPEVTIKEGESQQITLKEIQILGSTKLNPEEVKLALNPLIGKNLNLNEIIRICNYITTLYKEQGYLNSFAYLPDQTITATDGVVNIQVVEGDLEKLEFKKLDRELKAIIRNKLSEVSGNPLNVFDLASKLQELRSEEPRLVNLKASLSSEKKGHRATLTLEN